MSTPNTPTATITLRDGVAIPQLGFGVYQVPQERAAETVQRALAAGYRHIDTAAGYGNEAGVGAGVRASGIDRSEIFVTTKCPNTAHGYREARAAFERSLDLLDIDYVDLYLIHWPVPAHGRYVETWRAFVELAQEGRLRAIGVSNFKRPHLEAVIEATGVTPAVNQVELHPYLQQPELRADHAALGVGTESWSPLAQGAALAEPALVQIAERHGKTTAQVVIRWHLDVGNVVIPKSITPERIDENIDIYDFELGPDDHAAIAALDTGRRTGPDPDTFIGP